MDSLTLATLRAPRLGRTVRRCLVCGFREVRTDEVLEGGPVLLAECPRCEHRWTECLPGRGPALAVARGSAPAPGAAAA